MMDGASPVLIGKLLDRPLGTRRLLIFLLCGIIMAIEGFDMYMIGAIVPSLAAGLGVDSATVAQVFIAQGLGLAIGYTALSPFADRYGRRPMILLCVTGFGLVTLATIFATSITAVAALRFLAFVFFGGVVPNVISLVAEMVSVERRSRQVVLLNALFALGAAMGNLVAPSLVKAFGWHGPFLAGGLAPLALLPVLAWRLPESVRFMVLKEYPAARIRAGLRGLGIDPGEAACFELDEPPSRKLPIAALFTGGRLANTLLLMLAGGLMMLVGNLVASWEPTYLHEMRGYEMDDAARIFALSSLGAIVWPFALIALIRLIGLQRSLVVCYALGAASMMVFAISPFTPALAGFLAITFGAFVVGAISGVYALIAAAYPTEMRATALGWISGIGRLLAIAGPAVGGYMLAERFDNISIALVFAVPLALAGIAASLVRIRHNSG